MKLAVFGATGGTGQHVVKQALQRGHRVAAFVRSPHKLAADSQDLTVIQGNLSQLDTVAQAVAGSGAVISTLGPTTNQRTFAIAQGTEHIVRAMEIHGVRRLVLSAGAGVPDPMDEPNPLNRLINLLLKTFSRWVYEDMLRTVQHVRRSSLDWTVVRVPRLTDGEATGEVRFGNVGKGMGFQIARADLAKVMLDLAESSNYLKQAPTISH